MCGFFMGNIKFIHQIEEMANIPKDVTQGLPYLSIHGNSEIYIENYIGIMEYTREIIRIQTKIGRIQITGKCLHIEYYSNDEMKIKGYISKIELQTGGNTC